MRNSLFTPLSVQSIIFLNNKISEYCSDITYTSYTYTYIYIYILWIFILLDTKLKKLEASLKKKFDANGEESIETKLLEYQKKYESQKKAELNIEV